MKKIEFVVTETVTHNCTIEIDEAELAELEEDELEDMLLEHYYDNGSDYICNEEAEVTYINK